MVRQQHRRTEVQVLQQAVQQEVQAIINPLGSMTLWLQDRWQ